MRRPSSFFAAAAVLALMLVSLGTIVAVYTRLAPGAISCPSRDAATTLDASHSPLWNFQLNIGLIFSLSTFGVALLAARRRRTWPPLKTWLAVATSATIGGALLGVSTEELVHGSCRSGGWLTQDLLFVTGFAAPLLVSDALVSGRRLPAFVDLIGPNAVNHLSMSERVFGLVLLAITLIAAEMAFRHTFYPSSRGFPLAGMTMSVAPFLIVALLNGEKSERPRLTESVFAGLVTLVALYGAVSEGSHNWRTLWSSAVFLLLGAILYQARSTSE